MKSKIVIENALIIKNSSKLTVGDDPSCDFTRDEWLQANAIAGRQVVKSEMIDKAGRKWLYHLS